MRLAAHGPYFREHRVALANNAHFAVVRYGKAGGIEEGVKIEHERVDLCAALGCGDEGERRGEVKLASSDISKVQVLVMGARQLGF